MILLRLENSTATLKNQAAMRCSPSLLAGFVVKMSGPRPVPLPPPPGPTRPRPAALREKFTGHYSFRSSPSPGFYVAPSFEYPTKHARLQTTTYEPQVRDQGLKIGQVSIVDFHAQPESLINRFRFPFSAMIVR
jgi:hypothetical protein